MDASALFGNFENFQDLLDLYGEGIAIVDEHENFLYVNHTGAKIFGSDPGRLIGKNLREFTSQEEYTQILGITKQRKEGKTNTHDHWIRRPDGHRCYLRITSTPRFIDGIFRGSFSLFVDNTDTIQDQKRLEDSEKRFQLVSDIISDFAISFTIRNGLPDRIDWLSGALTKITGYTPKELSHVATWKLLGHPDDYPKLKNFYSKILTQLEPFSLQTRIITKEREIRWIEIFANPLFNKKLQQLSNIIIAGRDITETKQTEVKLKLIEYMVDHATESIYMFDKHASIKYVNEAACKLLGYSKTELMQMIIPQIDPNYLIDNKTHIWNLIVEKKSLTLLSQQITKEGITFPTEVTINHIVFQDNELAVAFVKDITRRKKEEEQQAISFSIFQSIYTSPDLGHFFLKLRKELAKLMDTSNLMLALVNKHLDTDLFYVHEEQLKTDIISPEGTLTGWILETKQPALLRSEEIYTLKKEGLIKIGNSGIKTWLGVPLFSGDQAIGVLSVEHSEKEDAFNDSHLQTLIFLSSQISLSIQRKQADDELKVSEQKLRESNISKDKFFSVIAHDLRGPFNSIIGFSDLLFTEYDSFDEEEKKAMIKNIYNASTGTFALLENLLEWSRVQTQRKVLNPENIDLSTITNSNLSLLKPQSEKKEIKLVSDIHFGTFAYCDENMIATVIRNLLSNAIKFSNPGGIVRIWSTVRENTVEVTVSDTGIGIAKKDIPKLLRLDETFKTRGTAGEQGTGLGLLLCREFIALNKGKLRIESEKGQGSRFTFTVPGFQN